jgi:hypothetical protein
MGHGVRSVLGVCTVARSTQVDQVFQAGVGLAFVKLANDDRVG